MILIYVHMVTDNAEDLSILLSNILGHKVIENLKRLKKIKKFYLIF